MSIDKNNQLSRRITIRRLGVTFIALGVSAGSLVGLAGAASAQTGQSPTSVVNVGKVPLTATQSACLTANGFPPKVKRDPNAAPLAATPKVKKSAAERDAQKAAKEAAKAICGIPAGKSGAKHKKVKEVNSGGKAHESKAGKADKQAGGKKHGKGGGKH